MKCKRCSELPKLDFKISNICILVPTSHHIEPIKDLLVTNGIDFSLDEDIFLAKSSSLRYLISLLEKLKLSNLEKNDIQLMPYPSSLGYHFQLRDLKNFKSLFYWSKLYSSDDLLYVLKNESLRILFHPIVRSVSNRIYGYEALTRGVREDGSIIPPNELFQIAKDTDLLFFLDRLCRETIIRRASELGISRKLFINFIPTSIYDPEKCLKSTDEAIYKYNLNPRQVIFEVVETEFIEDYNHLYNILDYYKSKGYSTALDDIGSGYSDLGALSELKTDYMKIDMDLVRDIDKDPKKQEIVSKYIRVAKSKNIYSLAEGVETRLEHEHLLKLGVDFIQGYYFAKPTEEPIKSINS